MSLEGIFKVRGKIRVQSVFRVKVRKVILNMIFDVVNWKIEINS